MPPASNRRVRAQADSSADLPDVQLDEGQRGRLRSALLAWYRRGHRDMPWRRSRDPYAIWISEIMLQQTRVDTVRDYFARFMKRFPTIDALATAPLADVLALWSGLGYYARARNLHAAAGEIAARYGSRFPSDAQAVRALPGIGPYTAGAILSIAFAQRAPILDGNVTRVLSRLFAIASGPERADGKRLYWRLAEELLPAARVSAGEARHESQPNDVGDFNQALMELGATVCLPHRPTCLVCPLADVCQARQENAQEVYPPAKAVRAVPVIHAVTAVVSPLEKAAGLGMPVLLARRPTSGLWGGLWEPPTLWLDAETDDRPAETPQRGLQRLLTERLGLKPTDRQLAQARPLAPFTHVLSHREIHFSPYALRLPLAGIDGLRLDGYDELRVVDARTPLGLALAAWVSALLSRVTHSEQAASI